ncbi:MAG: Smr/MutS family protein [Treponema sp.]|jgi:DNA-nicking Smr family endonuclease|nr:Smr/MutS family protein [Treponema sp.]
MGKKADFGDILAKWEGTSEAGRHTPAKGALEKWLANNKIIDKDSDSERTHYRGENRQRLLHGKPDDILDIHSLTSEEAWIALERFFTNSKDRGYKKLRIIHGKGNRSQGKTVLTHVVRNYIEKCRFAGESGFEKANHGGTGATWVLLK